MTICPRNDEDKNSSTINETARRANHFVFYEIVSSPGIEKNQKYFAFPEGQISGIDLPILLHQEGRSRSSRNAGQGAVDADVPVTKVLKRTAKSCGPDAPVLASSWRVKSR